MSFSKDLLGQIEAARAELRLFDLRRQDALLANLSFLYHLIVASENLLRVGILTAADAELKSYYEWHLEDECEHAQWLREDMAAVGMAPGPIHRQAMTAAGVQYYMLFHVNPASLLGYMAVLECFPVSLELVAELERRHGTALLRMTRKHAEVDAVHGQELLALIDRRPAEDQPAILESAMLLCHALREGTNQLEVSRG